MTGFLFAVNDVLGTSRRFPGILPAATKTPAMEITLLVLLGIAMAGISALGKLSLGLPGHNILRVILPMGLGLTLVPRRGAATVMGLSGMGAAAMLVLALGGRQGLGTGAITSLALTGLLVDLALWGARDGWSVYVRLALAGLGANLLAFLVRGGAKLVSGGAIEGMPLEVWLPWAAITYPVFGLLAGLISAAVWFRATRKP